MARKDENQGFVCAYCAQNIEKLSNGSYRNHCPFCLYSRHVDNRPGDRANTCGGLMAPVGVSHSGKKGWRLHHRCLACGHVSVNKVAENTAQPDDVLRIAALSRT